MRPNTRSLTTVRHFVLVACAGPLLLAMTPHATASLPLVSSKYHLVQLAAALTTVGNYGGTTRTPTLLDSTSLPGDGISNGAPTDLIFNSSAELTAGTYNDVTINNCATVVTLTGDIAITGALTVTACAELATNNFIVSGAGAFVLMPGGGIHITDANGITSGVAAAGNIQNSGGRSFSTGGNYYYDGNANQAAGNGLPSTAANLTIANTGGGGNNTVTGNAGQVVKGLLRVVAGVYSSHSAYEDVQIDAAGTLSLAGATTVSGDWTNNGSFLANGFGITFNGTTNQAIGGSSPTPFAALTISNTPQAAVVGGTGILTPAGANQLATWLGEGNLILTNIFTHTSGDGKTSAHFHAAVDGNGRTFSVLDTTEVNGAATAVVVGGYNPRSWNSSNTTYLSVDNAERTAFLYNLTAGTRNAQRLNIESGQFQSNNVAALGPSFGGGSDLRVAGSLNSGDANAFSYSGQLIGGVRSNTITFAHLDVFTIGVGAPANVVSLAQNISATTLNVTSGIFDTSAGNFTVTITGNVAITGGTFAANNSNINVAGNWANTATFVPGTSTVTFNGNGNTQTTSGTTAFHGMTVNHTGAGGVTLNTPLTVNGLLTLTSGNVTTGTNTLTVGGAGTLTRTGGFVAGNLQKQFSGPGSFTYAVGTGSSSYSPVGVTVTAGTGALTIKATQSQPPAVGAGHSIQRYWTLSGSGITTNLVFNYLQTDVQGTESAYRIIRIAGGVPSSFVNNCGAGSPCVDTTANTATINGIQNFSDWTVGENLAPTAAGATIAGRVLSANGRPIGNALIVLTGPNGESRLAQTGPFGYYSFTDLRVGALYVLTVKAGRFNFSTPSQTVDLTSDVLSADFVADP